MNEVLKNLFFKFDGRIGRQTYWLSSLMLCAAYFGVAILCSLAMSLIENAELPGLLMVGPCGIWFIAVVLVFWSSIAIAAKRWHDRDKSGWWQLIGLIPIIGAIWQLVEAGCLKGTEGDNRFGEDPLSTKKWPF